MSETYNLSKKSIRGLARNNREQRGRLAPLPKMDRRVYDNFQPVRMIVVSRGTLGGSKENTAILSTRPELWFDATVTDDDENPDVTELLDPEKFAIVKVSARFVSSVLFTGQQFIGCGQVSSFLRDSNSQFDVIQSPAITDFFATYRTGESWNCEIDFNQAANNADARKNGACPVYASNITGQTLVDGQRVIVRMIGGGWSIHEFFCADGYVDPGGDSELNGTGGGYPLP